LAKRVQILVIVTAILLVPSFVFAGSYHAFSAAKAVVQEDNTVVVPLQITNQNDLTAIDIPLEFSEGVTLKAVTFENTRVSYFDLKVANIKNDERTVVIGLLPQMSAEFKPDLQAGEGTIANLVFTIDDPTVDQIEIKTVTMDKPSHELMFVYHDGDQLRVETPDINLEPVSLNEAAKAGPSTFGLNQNYPNPFNPSTTISFSLAKECNFDLTIYNITGQEVDNISQFGQKGPNEVVWDASRFASGVYFYRLEADNQSDTKKMVLLK
jgi:hypothetical protein